MWFEKAFLWLQQVEKVIVFPMVILSALTMDLEKMKEPNANHWLGAITLVICGLKLLRSAFSDCAKQFMVLLVTLLYFQYNADTGRILGEGQTKTDNAQYPFILYYFVTSIVFHKLYEFYLKVQFVITYIAPWQITWGSAFHAFAQPFSVPHSAMLFLQAAISSVFSTPLNPILGNLCACKSKSDFFLHSEFLGNAQLQVAKPVILFCPTFCRHYVSIRQSLGCCQIVYSSNFSGILLI